MNRKRLDSIATETENEIAALLGDDFVEEKRSRSVDGARSIAGDIQPILSGKAVSAITGDDDISPQTKLLNHASEASPAAKEAEAAPSRLISSVSSQEEEEAPPKYAPMAVGEIAPGVTRLLVKKDSNLFYYVHVVKPYLYFIAQV